MKRLVLFILGTVIVVLFAVANSHHVEISLIFGAPLRMRMIFLIAGVFTSGVLCTLGIQEWRTVKQRRREAAIGRATEEKASTQKDLLDGLD